MVITAERDDYIKKTRRRELDLAQARRVAQATCFRTSPPRDGRRTRFVLLVSRAGGDETGFHLRYEAAQAPRVRPPILRRWRSWTCLGMA